MQEHSSKLFNAASLEGFRLLIFALWIGFAVIITFLPMGLLARPQNEVAREDILKLMKLFTGLWMPVMACFAGFWFSTHNENLKNQKPTTGQRIGALTLTLLYFAVSILVICFTIFIERTEFDSGTGAIIGPTLMDRASDVTSWLILVGAPALVAPIAFLTGQHPQFGADNKSQGNGEDSILKS